MYNVKLVNTPQKYFSWFCHMVLNLISWKKYLWLLSLMSLKGGYQFYHDAKTFSRSPPNFYKPDETESIEWNQLKIKLQLKIQCCSWCIFIFFQKIMRVWTLMLNMWNCVELSRNSWKLAGINRVGKIIHILMAFWFIWKDNKDFENNEQFQAASS